MAKRTKAIKQLLKNSFGFSNDTGELINEGKIVNGKGSAGLSIKGHHPQKDGIPAYLLAAEAVTARRATLTDPSSLKDGCSSSHLQVIRIS